MKTINLIISTKLNGFLTVSPGAGSGEKLQKNRWKNSATEQLKFWKEIDSMLSGIYDSFQHWGKNYQTVWIYSDPHFDDAELANNIVGRPTPEEQVKRINTKCGRRDCLIILGDVGNVEYVRQLRAGHKVLIMGNHDTGASNYKRQVITRVYDQDKYTKEEILAKTKAEFHNWKITIKDSWESPFSFRFWVVTVDNLLFDEVYEGALIVAEKLILTHEPVEIPWLFNIHGHDHTDYKRKNHLNVCSDVINWEPINFNQFLKSGFASKIQTIHRETIDKATKRKKKRKEAN
jgi:calcineurin-like phosphoesterase family protein